MKRQIVSWRRTLKPADAVLALLGLLGLLLYLTLLPAQHPDSTAAADIPPADLEAKAEAFITANGFLVTSDLEQRLTMNRNASLLDSLQADYGRPQAVRLLAGDARAVLPAYYWQHRLRRGTGEERTEVLNVSMTLRGRVFAFEADPSLTPVRPVYRPALRYALEGDIDAHEETAPEPLLAASDSALYRLLGFALDPRRAPPGQVLPGQVLPQALTAAALDTALARGRVVRWPAEAAAALARYHLGRTAFHEVPFTVDSVRAAPRPRLEAARVFLQADTLFFRQPLRLEVVVAASGILLELKPHFQDHQAGAAEGSMASEEADNVSFSLSDDSGAVAGVLTGLAYVLLTLLTLYLFARRLRGRAVDTAAALRDGLWGGAYAATIVLMSTPRPILDTVPQLWLGLLIVAANVIIVGIAGGLIVFLASGGMDSAARAVWPHKLTTLTLVRHGVYRNVPVGAALLRGLLTACLLLGLMTLLLALLPRAAVDFNVNGPLESYSLLSVTASVFGQYAWLSLFVNFTVMLGVGTWLYRNGGGAVVVTGLTVVLAVLQVMPLDVGPQRWQLLVSILGALVLALAFWRYDFTTTFVALLVTGLLWGTQNGWLMPGSPMATEALFAGGLVAVLAVVGLVGLFSGTSDTELPSFVPSYIEELAQEERMKGELELAHQVQASFLPRRMPRVEGLEVAAMCLPAFDVGGDYYDFVELGDGRLGVVVGDVSGKGIQAAFYMTLVKGFWQTLARSVSSPAEVLRRLNGLFYENVPRGTFISMIYGVIDVPGRTFTFARAGHNPIIVKRSPSQTSELVRPPGLGIGLIHGARFDQNIEEATLSLRPGDVLVFYTDGFSEAMNLRKELYSDERLAERVGDVGRRAAGEILRFVSEDVHHFMEAAGRHDDMTMVVLKLHVPAGYAPAAASKPAAASSLTTDSTAPVAASSVPSSAEEQA